MVFGEGVNSYHHPIAYFKIDDLLSLYRSNYTAVPSEYHLRSANIDRFLTCEALFPAHQIKGAIILSKHHYVHVLLHRYGFVQCWIDNLVF